MKFRTICVNNPNENVFRDVDSINTYIVINLKITITTTSTTTTTTTNNNNKNYYNNRNRSSNDKDQETQRIRTISLLRMKGYPQNKTHL